MSLLDYSVYAQIIEPAFTNSEKTFITRTLFGFLDSCQNIKNKKGEPFDISNQIASGWWNKTSPIPLTIRKEMQNESVIKIIENHFNTTVFPELYEDKLDDVLSQFLSIIGKQNINTDLHTKLLNFYNNNELSEFLAHTFILAVQQSKHKRKNAKSATKNADALASAQNLENNINELISILSRIPELKRIMPPKNPSPSEATYISQLYAAYGDAEGLPSFSEKDLASSEKYKNNLNRQRESYYAAESVRRGSQDLQIVNKENLFNSLKDETYDGIIDVHEQPFENGFERLNKVLIHATTLPITKSILGRIPQWIGSNEKKGICHMLVNDGRLKWVNK